jgi:hypothetical protein
VWADVNSSEVFSRVWDAFDAGENVIVCAWCGRVRLDGDWFRTPPAAVEAIDARLAFSHSICSGCAEAYPPPSTPAPTDWSEPRPRGMS